MLTHLRVAALAELLFTCRHYLLHQRIYLRSTNKQTQETQQVFVRQISPYTKDASAVTCRHYLLHQSIYLRSTNRLKRTQQTQQVVVRQLNFNPFMHVSCTFHALSKQVWQLYCDW
jgi:hypothetical protein